MLVNRLAGIKSAVVAHKVFLITLTSTALSELSILDARVARASSEQQSTRQESYLFHGKFSTELLDNEVGISLHLGSANIH